MKLSILDPRCSSNVETRDDTPSGSSWILGEFRNGDYVYWKHFRTEEEGRKFASHCRHSVIAFDPDGKPIFFSSVYSNIDAACILAAKDHLQTSRSTRIDRSEVRRKVDRGDLPLVPISRPLVQQMLLKLSMDATFNRQSIRFFACGPLKYTSLYYFDVKTYPKVKGHVALTVDDAPCHFQSKSNSRLDGVAKLLKAYNAHATFMVVGRYVRGHEDDLVKLLEQGHELGNHGMMDRPYHQETVQEFGRAVDECSNLIRSLQQQAKLPQQVKWFRAPHGKYTQQMEDVLNNRKLQNVMCDTYASCPIVQDGEYIGQKLARNAQDGSIVLLHMPGKGFRDWCFTALQRFLAESKEKCLTVVSVSELEELAGGTNSP